MRIGAIILSLAIVLTAPQGLFAQSGQWQTRSAPQSWGTPAIQQNQTAPYVANPTRQSPRSLNEALTCAAAMQLATMAAPNWARERGVTDSTNAWLQKVFELAQNQGIGGDAVPAMVETEMQRQVDEAAMDPANLSRRAFDCASVQP